MSATLLLVRHASHSELGHSLSGRSDIALNNVGRAEAERLAGRLTRRRIDAIHASPRRRAIETAEILAAPHGLKVEIADALDEVDFGAFAGRSFAELTDDPDWHDWNAARDVTRCPGGETMAEAVARCGTFIETLAKVGTTSLFVSHCDIIRGVVAATLGLGFDRMFGFDCDPASLTTLRRADHGWRLATLNQHAD